MKKLLVLLTLSTTLAQGNITINGVVFDPEVIIYAGLDGIHIDHAMSKERNQAYYSVMVTNISRFTGRTNTSKSAWNEPRMRAYIFSDLGWTTAWSAYKTNGGYHVWCPAPTYSSEKTEWKFWSGPLPESVFKKKDK